MDALYSPSLCVVQYVQALVKPGGVMDGALASLGLTGFYLDVVPLNAAYPCGRVLPSASPDTVGDFKTYMLTQVQTLISFHLRSADYPDPTLLAQMDVRMQELIVKQAGANAYGNVLDCVRRQEWRPAAQIVQTETFIGFGHYYDFSVRAARAA